MNPLLAVTLFFQIWGGEGTWKLNVSKSTYVGSLPHQAMTLTFRSESNAIRLQRKGINAEGTVIDDEEIMYPDGVERPYQGRRNVDTYICRRLDDFSRVT